MDLAINLPLPTPPEILSAEDVTADIDFLIFSLRHAYIGIDMIPRETEGVIRQLERVKQEAESEIKTEVFGKQVGTILCTLPDGHVYVKQGNTVYMDRSRERMEWAVGKNVGLGEKNDVWNVKKISIAGNSVPILSILKFPNPNDKRWDGLESVVYDMLRSSMVIVDLRGNSGGNSEMAKKLAHLFINETVRHPNKKVITKNSPEARTLMVNAFKLGKMHAEKKREDISYFEKLLDGLERDRKDAEKDGAPPLIIEEYKNPDTTHIQFGGVVYIFADRNCGSSGEHLVRLLKFHPNSVFVGEPTAGSIHFGNSGVLVLPHSTIVVRLCTKHFVLFEDGFFEKTGYLPDIVVPVHTDALEYIKKL